MGRPLSQSQDKFILRLPDGMRDQLKAIAAANKRTLTAEIVMRLQASLEETTVTADQFVPINSGVEYKLTELDGSTRLMWTQIQELQKEVNRLAKYLGK